MLDLAKKEDFEKNKEKLEETKKKIEEAKSKEEIRDILDNADL
jgi:cellobiose-specific phosphotransferase system component IIA